MRFIYKTPADRIEYLDAADWQDAEAKLPDGCNPDTLAMFVSEFAFAEQLPVYELLIDESESSEVEVNYVALVDKPAIEKNFVAFRNHPTPMAFATIGTDEERFIIGPAMIPDMPIYRSDPENGEYLVKFSKATIEKIALKFFEKGYQSNVNLQHDEGQQVEGVTFFQSFIKDTAKGVAGVDGYPDGTWFLGAKVKNDAVWGKIKAGEVRGFSVEGVFKYSKPQRTPQQVYNEIRRLLAELNEPN